MADSDEDKVKAALAKEVEDDNPDETADEGKDLTESTESQDESQKEESSSEEEQSSKVSTFTKPQGFEWVKGDTQEEFIAGLTEAYKNSTGEALRLKDQLKTATTPTDDKGQTTDLNTLPEIQMLRAEQQSKMIEAFDEFAQKYPQAREPDSFEKFQKASDGVAQAFVAANGRLATYPELFNGVAQVLGWQASQAAKDAALKSATASSGAAGGTTAAPPKRSPFSNKTLEITRRIPGNERKSDAALIKELTETMQITGA